MNNENADMEDLGSGVIVDPEERDRDSVAAPETRITALSGSSSRYKTGSSARNFPYEPRKRDADDMSGKRRKICNSRPHPFATPCKSTKTNTDFEALCSAVLNPVIDNPEDYRFAAWESRRALAGSSSSSYKRKRDADADMSGAINQLSNDEYRKRKIKEFEDKAARYIADAEKRMKEIEANGGDDTDYVSLCWERMKTMEPIEDLQYRCHIETKDLFHRPRVPSRMEKAKNTDSEFIKKYRFLEKRRAKMESESEDED